MGTAGEAMSREDCLDAADLELRFDARVALPEAQERYQRAEAERDRWVRLFNRLEAAVSHHKKASARRFVDDHDEALYAARDRICRDAANPDVRP
jgi:1,2-phenylacetyl-CoA epoxidase PaaB subunit